MTSGELIRLVRKQRGMTQKQLADNLGISYVNISQYENGKRNPKIKTLEKIADALSVPVGALMGYEDEESLAPQMPPDALACFFEVVQDIVSIIKAIQKDYIQFDHNPRNLEVLTAYTNCLKLLVEAFSKNFDLSQAGIDIDNLSLLYTLNEHDFSRNE